MLDDWIITSGWVVIAVSALIAVEKALRALIRRRRTRRRGGRAARLDVVQATLLQLRHYGPQQVTGVQRIGRAQAALTAERQRLDPRDRHQLPALLTVIRAERITPEMVERALSELALLRGRRR